VENELVIKIRLSSMSEKVIFFSSFLYCPFALIKISTAETKAERTALSGEPPYSRKLEL
jgi:hypothetical protein